MADLTTPTFGAWTYDPAYDTIEHVNGYYLHRDQPHYKAEFWLRHLRGKNWYEPLVIYGEHADRELIKAMKFAGWIM